MYEIGPRTTFYFETQFAMLFFLFFCLFMQSIAEETKRVLFTIIFILLCLEVSSMSCSKYHAEPHSFPLDYYYLSLAFIVHNHTQIFFCVFRYQITLVFDVQCYLLFESSMFESQSDKCEHCIDCFPVFYSFRVFVDLRIQISEQIAFTGALKMITSLRRTYSVCSVNMLKCCLHLKALKIE